MCTFFFKNWKINTLSSKSMQTEKAKSSHFDRTRGDKNQIFPTLVQRLIQHYQHISVWYFDSRCLVFLNFQFNYSVISKHEIVNYFFLTISRDPREPLGQSVQNLSTVPHFFLRECSRAENTPPRTPRISGLKSQILKPKFLS